MRHCTSRNRTHFGVCRKMDHGAQCVHACQGQHERTPRCPPTSSLQDKLNLSVLSGCDGDFLLLFAELLVPDSHRVRSGGHVVESEGLVLVGHSIVRVLCDGDPCSHPLVYVGRPRESVLCDRRNLTRHGSVKAPEGNKSPTARLRQKKRLASWLTVYRQIARRPGMPYVCPKFSSAWIPDGRLVND